MHPIDHIRKFTSLTPDLESRLMAMMGQKNLQKGEVLSGLTFLQNIAVYIQTGSARIFYTSHGREHTVSFSFADQFVIVPYYFTKKYGDTVAVEFLEPTTIISFHPRPVREELEESGAISESEGLFFFNAALIQYTQFLEERVDVMQTLGAKGRYEWALRRFPRLTECASTTQIASFLGLTKETLYRIKNGNYN